MTNTTNQLCGLSDFDSRIPRCPCNPNAIRSIVFSRDDLAVVNAEVTEIAIPMTDFYIPIGEASKSSFTLPAMTANRPYDIYKLDLCGLDLNDEVKFIGILPTYDVPASLSIACGGTVTSEELKYIEWCFCNDIDEGVLYDKPSVSPFSVSTLSFDISKINKMEFSWGGYVSATGASGSLWAATDGGLLKWDGETMTLWNTLNSTSCSDFMNWLIVDSNDVKWIGTENGGLESFVEDSDFSIWNVDNSEILSNKITCLREYSTFLAIGTDKGVSLFDKDETWTNLTKYNSSKFKHESVSSLATFSEYIFIGTTGGVYSYDYSMGTWKDVPYNSLNTTGWTGPDSVTSMDAYDGKVYVGTTGGMVVISVEDDSAMMVFSSNASNSFKSLRVVDYYDSYRVYAGFTDGIGIYDISTSSWLSDMSSSTSGFSYLSTGMKDVIPDSRSGNIYSSNTLFMGSETLGESIGKMTEVLSVSPLFSYVPESDKLTNLLLSYPLNPSCTDTECTTLIDSSYIDESDLYSSVGQPLFFLFSKNMVSSGTGASSSFENFLTVREGLTSSSSLDVVEGTWNWTYADAGRVGIFVPNASLIKSQGYNLTLENGATALDGSYVSESFNVGFFTENIQPILGWRSLGMMLVHSGSDTNLTQGLYLRNPQESDVDLTILIGR